jgi:hypothetical protein
LKFNYIQVDSLPRLAWCARVEKGSDAVAVYHGAQVETCSDFFAEGAWNGGFNAEDFARATILCGTGGQLFDGGVRFVSSTDRCSPVFSIRKPDAVYVSNSPVFVLSVAGEKPDPIYPFYGYDLVRIWRQGLFCLDGKFRTMSGTPLCMHLCARMSLGPDLSVSFETHPLDPCFQGFEQYKQLLTDGIAAVLRNSRDPKRNAPFEPLAAVTKGYDSSAIAALAASAGCKEAVTLADSNLPDPTMDCGDEIAGILGMSCSRYDRRAYREQEPPVDAEFALFTLSSSAPVAAFEKKLHQRVFLCGQFGGIIWEEKQSCLIDSLSDARVRVVTGMGHVEFRLRAGYLVFMPAYIGGRHHRAVHAITTSEAMRNWKVGGDYDRPIPRRIVEEAGVPRNAFGVEKHAGGHVEFVQDKIFSVRGLEAYERFVRDSHAAVPGWRYRTWRFCEISQDWFWRNTRSLRRRNVLSSASQRRFPFLLNREPRLIPWKYMFLFQWTVDSLKSRYQVPERDGV